MYNDEYYMEKALALALKASVNNEIPIGAIVVDSSGKIVGRGYNTTEKDHSQSSHAEIKALRQAGKRKNDWRLDTCTIYVTVEPCCMCLGLICLSRIKRIVFGARSPLFGYDLDKESMPDLYKKHIKGITRGVLANQAQDLLKDFFKKRRMIGE